MKRALCVKSASHIFFVVALFFACVSLATAATETLLHQFVSQARGSFPQSLVSDGEGNLYGMTQDGGTHGFGSVFKLAQESSGKWTETVIYSFTGLTDGNNYFPYTNENSLTIDNAGNLYGSTPEGGLACNCGVVFQLSPGRNGTWKYSVLYSFQGGKTDGYTPSGPLAFDEQGNLWGTTAFGGNQSSMACPESSCGTVFQLSPSPNGWQERVVHFFNSAVEGANPENGVVIGPDGTVYGTTSTFSDVASTVFQLTLSGNNWVATTLHSFTAAGDASNPWGVILDASGNLYGAAYQGGANGFGAVFELTHGSSWTESVLYSFANGAGGFSPTGNVVFDGNGNLLGVTGSGGSGNGVVYRLTPSNGVWTESVLYSFNGGNDGARPVSNVIFDSAGDIFGVTYNGAKANYGTVYELISSAGTYTKNPIFAFPGTDGSFASSTLIADNAGNFYGTTSGGGLNLCSNGGANLGCGLVFKLSKSSKGNWQTTILHEFSGRDGGYPNSLTLDSAGDLIGTTAGGVGAISTAFKMSPAGSGWTFRTLHKFGSRPYDGAGPVGPLILDSAGNIYGATSSGGNGSYLNCSPCGTVFKLTPTGSGSYNETIIYNFQGFSDGNQPLAGVVMDATGNLYGTTYTQEFYGCGVVYRLSPNSDGSWTQATLYTFTCGADGGGPQGALILDSSGNLYGTASVGGTGTNCGFGCGVVFELTPSSTVPWNETVIYDFTYASGAFPESALTFDNAGNLYGTAHGGGNSATGCLQGCGAVFKLSPSVGGWQETLLYSFSGPTSDGANPLAGVILDSAGNVYGTTSVGGINGYDYENGGTIYQITQ